MEYGLFLHSSKQITISIGKLILSLGRKLNDEKVIFKVLFFHFMCDGLVDYQM